jgi:hypothetical protein
MNKSISKDDCLYSICRFPLLYAESGLTPKEIVEYCRYEKYRDEISIDDIVKELKKDMKLIDSWLLFTDDKRWTPAWGIKKEKGSYTIFYVFRNGKTEIEQSFSSEYEACARLVRMEMEGLL